MQQGVGRLVYERWRMALLGALALLMLLPVTLPVTVLRSFVQERFGVSEFLTSLFMSINMVGALISAPLAGALADRFGRRRELITVALVADAALLLALTLPVSFPLFLALRFLEGGAHIFALSLLLALASVLGSEDPLVPLRVGCAVLVVAAVLAWCFLLEVEGGEKRPGLARILAALRENRALLAPLAFAFTDRFTVGFYTTTFSLYLSRIHEIPAPRIGLLVALFMLPFALLSYPFGRLSELRSPVFMVCAGSLAYGAGTALVPWWPPDVLAGLMVALGAASAVMLVPSMVLTTDLAPPEIRGTALGAFNAAGSLGFILGPAVGGLVSERVAAAWSWEAGYRSAFALAGVSEVLCVALTLPLLLRLVRQGRAR
jgi:MFS family permease